MLSIYDLVNAEAIATYWKTLTQGQPPYLFETLFLPDQQLGLDMSYIKGASGLPVVLKTSAFDAEPIPRNRIGFETMQAEMPFFRESMYIDEKLRQQLNTVMMSNNQSIKDTILQRILNDTVRLVESARVTRERMCAMAVTSGTVVFGNNGQEYIYDYGVPDNHKITEINFSATDFDIAGFINDKCTFMETETGVRPKRMVCSRHVMDIIIHNQLLAKNVYVLTNGVGTINQQTAVDYIRTQTGVSIEVYSKMYKDESGKAMQYIPDNVFTLFPEGNLGRSMFGTTPEESDLMAGQTDADVQIVDTGVAISTIVHKMPVNIETVVSMINMPSFELADQVLIVDISTATA